MDEPFKDMMDDMPSWQELGRQVVALRKDGSVVTGEVVEVDMTPGPDEWPILAIEVAGETVGWFEFEGWRYAEAA